MSKQGVSADRQSPENDAPRIAGLAQPTGPCSATDCDRQIACRPPAPTCPHPFYSRANDIEDVR